MGRSLSAGVFSQRIIVVVSIAMMISLAVLVLFPTVAFACDTAMTATANPCMRKGSISSGCYTDTNRSDCSKIRLAENKGHRLDARWESWQHFSKAPSTQVSRIKVYFEANSSDSGDWWYIRFYDYSRGAYSSTWYQLGSGGFSPCDYVYTVAVTDNAAIQRYLNQNGNFKIDLRDGKASGRGRKDKTRTYLSIDYFAVEFTYDRCPPVISNVNAKHSENDPGAVTVTWDTNKPATSQVKYGPSADYGNSSPQNHSLSTSHSVSLSNLSPGTVYHFGVCSEDAVGNLAVSGDYTFKTTQWIYATPATAPAPIAINPALRMAFVGGNSTDINAINTEIGTQAWAPFNTGGTIYSRSLVPKINIAGTGTDVVYSASSDGFLYVLSALTGAPLNSNWPKRITTASLRGGIAGQGNVNIAGVDPSNTNKIILFVGTYDASTTSGNKIIGLDAVTGNILWTFQGGEANPSLGAIATTPTVDRSRNTVYFSSYANGGTTQPSLWALDTTTGKLKWSKNLGDISSSPTISVPAAGSNVFVGTDQGYLYKFDPNGNQMWMFYAAGASAVRGFPWVEGNKIYFSTASGRVYLVIDGGNTVAVDAMWGSGTGYVNILSPSAPLVVAGLGKLYVGSSDGNLYELGLTNGTVVNKQCIGYSMSDPTLDTDRLYLLISAANGKVYCFPVPF